MAATTLFIMITILSLMFTTIGMVNAVDLRPDFYSRSCPKALGTIQSIIRTEVAKEPRLGASLLRLHFHDCFVNTGCDASVLLDDSLFFIREKQAFPNANSLRGFKVIDTIKSQLEILCPETFSCADILAVAARDSVVALGGPAWTVPLGRRDSINASFTGANMNLPAPTLDLSGLIAAFAKKGFTTAEMVTLSGGHTIGQARCKNFRTRIYTESNIDQTYAASLRMNCPVLLGDDNLSPLDNTSTIFDNTYYKDLTMLKGLLHSDQQLFNNGSTDSLVVTYSKNVTAFFIDFAKAMVKMGNIVSLNATEGQVRTNCRKIN